MDEINRLKELISRKELEAQELPNAKKHLRELEKAKAEDEQLERQRKKALEEKAIHNTVDKNYSWIYVKHDGRYLPVEKVWVTLSREVYGCASDAKTNAIKFFRITEGVDELFVEKYKPK